MVTSAITNEAIRDSLSRGLATTQTGVPMNTPPKQQKKIALANIYRYENNPRKTTNELLQAIKDSIRAKGLQQMFDVTQRPEDREAGRYVQSSGGGTRLEALQSLLAEDQAAGIQNSPYEYVFCMFQPYVDELTIEIAHLVENLQRTQMNYWDSAVGMMRFKASIEAKLGRTLALRDLEAETAKLGMGLGRQTLSLYQFGYTHFYELGAQAANLSATKMEETLRPTYLAAQRLATRGDASGEGQPLSNEAFKETVADPTLRAYASELGDTGVFDAKTLAKRLEQAVADAVGFDVKSFASLNALAVSNAGASLAELLGKDVKTQSIFGGDDGEGHNDDQDIAGNAAPFDAAYAPPAPPIVATVAAPPSVGVPSLPPAAHEREQASGSFTPVTDAEMAELERQNALLTAQVSAQSNTKDQDPMAAMTTSIIAAVIASQAAVQASNNMANVMGHTAASAGRTIAPVPLISFTGTETPAQILDVISRSARERVQHIAATYGIEDCIVDAPLLPLGYVMDLPATPFTVDTVAEAWWMLSYLSSLSLLDPQDIAQFIARLPKDASGEELTLAEFLRYFMAGEEGEALQLIGFNIRSADLGTFFWALCFPASPCSDAMLELMQLIRILNQLQPSLMRHPLLPMNTPLTQVQGLLLNGYGQGNADNQSAGGAYVQ